MLGSSWAKMAVMALTQVRRLCLRSGRCFRPCVVTENVGEYAHYCAESEAAQGIGHVCRTVAPKRAAEAMKGIA